MVVRPDGRLTDDGGPGELVHCWPLVAKGYWRDAERTALRFRPAPAASRYGGTAVWSGDNAVRDADGLITRSEEHTSELQSLMRISYAVFCLKKKNTQINTQYQETTNEQTQSR